MLVNCAWRLFIRALRFPVGGLGTDLYTEVKPFHDELSS